MIGPLEIAIIAVILLVVFGYRYADRLPGVGRRAGEGAREVTDKGVREAREFRDALSGEADSEPNPQTDREPDVPPTRRSDE